MQNLMSYDTTATPPLRRFVAAGVIRRNGDRTTRITATAAGTTGSIRPAAGVR
ncbi:hypothetical protein [Actinacidiphila alni]|uniref:hypothetical protein n=1 Tax=Actinacidiphila alni TaxID=380248 RepID=UPI0034551A0B